MQRKSLALLIVLTMATVISCAKKTAEWLSYTSKEGRYSVLLPHEPTLNAEETTSDSGATIQQHLALASDFDSQYIIQYFDVTHNTIGFSFDRARDAMVKGVKGTLISESPIKLENYEGRELKISTMDGEGAEVLVTARYYVVEKRVYGLQHLSRKSDASATAGSRTKFFDSFKVAKGV